MKHETLQGQQTPAIIRIRENIVYQNRFATICDDDVRFADGRTGTYIRVVQSGGLPGVVMLPVANGHAGLVRVYRYAVGMWEWGLPRGLAHGADPEQSARNELLEELGAQPSALTGLGEMTPDSGTLAAVVHLFLASYPAPVSDARDRCEVAGIRWLPVTALRAEIAEGQIRDGFTLAAMCAAACRGLLP